MAADSMEALVGWLLSIDSFRLIREIDAFKPSSDSKRDRGMKVGHLQYLSGIDVPQFDTLNRRGHVSFLTRDVGVGVNRFDEAHALALTVFAYLRRVGVQPASACVAVNDSWNDIRAVSGITDDAVGCDLCGSRINHLGINDTWGSQHPESRSGQDPVSSAAVNLRTLWDWMQPTIAGLTSS
jgi:hypothetical protein